MARAVWASSTGAGAQQSALGWSDMSHAPARTLHSTLRSPLRCTADMPRHVVLLCAAPQVRIASGGGRMAVTMDRYEVSTLLFWLLETIHARASLLAWWEMR